MTKHVKTNIIRAGLVLVFLLATTWEPLFGQEIKVIRDFKLWSGVELEKSVGKNWKFMLEEEVRLQKNATEAGSILTEAGVEYTVDKNISLEAVWRYTRNRKKNNAFENRSRYAFDLNYEGELRALALHARLRYQKEVESLNLFDLKIPYEKHFRTRVEFRYLQSGKFEPFVSAELFQLYELNSYPEFEKCRVLAGARIDVSKHGDAKISYGFDRELNSFFPSTYYILKLNYTFKF